MLFDVVPPLSTTCRRGAGPEADSIRQEAEVLTHARHPGVVELLAFTADGDGAEIVTTLPAGRALGQLALGVEEIAGVVAALATTVADLHDIGIAHRRLDATWVTIGDDGRVVLDGFGDAIRLPGAPSTWPDHPAARADDRALGDLLGGLLERCAPPQLLHPLEGPTRRRLLPSRLQAADAGPAATMRRWARWAGAGSVPGRRLADALATGVPGARLPTTRSHRSAAPVARDDVVAVGPVTSEGSITSDAMERWFAHGADPVPGSPTTGIDERRAPVGRRSRRGSAAAAIGVVVLSTVFAAVVVARSPAPEPVGSPGCVAGTTDVRSTDAVTPGCATYQGGTLTVGPARFAVGRPGDVAAIGRWYCGDATLALLRPATGEIWTFGPWPVGGTSVAAHLAGAVAGAVRLAVVRHDRCDTLLAVGAGGAAVVRPAP